LVAEHVSNVERRLEDQLWAIFGVYSKHPSEALLELYGKQVAQGTPKSNIQHTFADRGVKIGSKYGVPSWTQPDGKIAKKIVGVWRDTATKGAVCHLSVSFISVIISVALSVSGRPE
jgi:hypothetical protein